MRRLILWIPGYLKGKNNMPTYDYQCRKCKYTFEEFQSIMDDPLKKCPKCKKNSLQRLISAGAGIIFKGSGFYQTDYRSESYSKDAKKEKESDPKNSSSKKSDEKPSKNTTKEKKET
jgi:putative FmdB family regulatory protein